MIQAVVLGVDVKNQRVSLGVKQLTPDPWSTIEEKFSVGSQHEVKVVRIVDFGAFVELEPEVEGLIHVSEPCSGTRGKTWGCCQSGR